MSAFRYVEIRARYKKYAHGVSLVMHDDAHETSFGMLTKVLEGSSVEADIYSHSDGRIGHRVHLWTGVAKRGLLAEIRLGSGEEIIIEGAKRFK